MHPFIKYRQVLNVATKGIVFYFGRSRSQVILLSDSRSQMNKFAEKYFYADRRRHHGEEI